MPPKGKAPPRFSWVPADPARRVRGYMSPAQYEQPDAFRTALLDWLQDDWQEENVSLPDIYQRGPYAIRDRNTAYALVKILEGHGWLIRVLQGAVVLGQPRREAWRIVRRG